MSQQTKKIETPEDMPQLMSRVGVLKAGMTYELPADIADDLIKTRGCKAVGGKTKTAKKPVEQAEKR